jgi:hypothetical protein
VFCLLYARCTSDAYTATYPTVLTIVHLDGTSILSLYSRLSSDIGGKDRLELLILRVILIMLMKLMILMILMILIIILIL